MTNNQNAQGAVVALLKHFGIGTDNLQKAIIFATPENIEINCTYFAVLGSELFFKDCKYEIIDKPVKHLINKDEL
jgi:hypothetical protein